MSKAMNIAQDEYWAATHNKIYVSESHASDMVHA